MKSNILRECLRLAKEKNETRNDTNFRHYSFIIQKNKIIEMGQNIPYAEALIHFGYPENSGIHAECMAYKRAKGIMDHDAPFEMVNIRLSKAGKMRLSKPCECCYTFLQIQGCAIVHFSTDIGFAKLRIGEEK